jgi:hypothetical protein
VSVEARRELVVARHREDVRWVSEVSMPVHVYHTGSRGQDLLGLGDHVWLYARPNDGREAGVYLRHIVSRWDDLAEWVLFTQANPFPHSPDFLNRIELTYEVPTSLTCQYLPDRPKTEVKAKDCVVRIGDVEVRYGLATAFDHCGAHNRPWFNAAAWEHVFPQPLPEPMWFGYAACWAVPRASIQARGLPFWQWLYGQLRKAPRACGMISKPPINPWSLEGMWYYLWRAEEWPHREECVT